MKKDSRQFRRLDAGYLLRYEVDKGAGNVPRITNIKNLSAGGLKFLTREPLPENTSVRINVLIPVLERSFQAHAQILRVRRLNKRFVYSVAVRFTDMSSDDQKILAQYVEAIANNPNAEIHLDHANVVVKEK